jgi:hypothetical protein
MLRTSISFCGNYRAEGSRLFGGKLCILFFMSAVRQAASKLGRNIANKTSFLDVNTVKITKNHRLSSKTGTEIT